MANTYSRFGYDFIETKRSRSLDDKSADGICPQSNLLRGRLFRFAQMLWMAALTRSGVMGNCSSRAPVAS
jgi:hypothetical protein